MKTSTNSCTSLWALNTFAETSRLAKDSCTKSSRIASSGLFFWDFRVPTSFLIPHVGLHKEDTSLVKWFLLGVFLICDQSFSAKLCFNGSSTILLVIFFYCTLFVEEELFTITLSIKTSLFLLFLVGGITYLELLETEILAVLVVDFITFWASLFVGTTFFCFYFSWALSFP